MNYFTVKISMVGYEDRLNRTMLIRENITLDELAASILSAFNTFAYHMYMFIDNKNKYECEISYREGIGFNDEYLCSYNYKFCDLDFDDNNSIRFIYDFGCDYEFEIKILSLESLKKINRIPIILDGVGYGICEDNKDELLDYLDGITDGEDLFFCVGSKFKKVDFNYFNVEEQNKEMKKEFNLIYDAYFVID